MAAALWENFPASKGHDSDLNTKKGERRMTPARSGRACVLLAILTTASLSAQAQVPEVFLIDGQTLAAAREAYRSGGGEYKKAILDLVGDAARVMKAEPGSVMLKTELPPSGDMHDYMSVAPYWWPDSTRPGGVPYIRRDGVTNPEHNRMGDRVRLGRLIGDVRTLALAYYICDKEEYAARAVLHLKTWFLDPATRMNPHLKYAQSIKGVIEGRGIGIIDTYGFRDLIDAMQLLKGSRYWTEEIDKGMKEWFASYLKWLLESTNGKEESAAKNNHGTTYDVQVVSIALYLGKREVAREILLAAGPKRVAVQIEPDGSQPLELERTKSLGYSLMNAEALTNIAMLGKYLGVDLWHFETNDGRSIGKAVDYLLPYALGEKKWLNTQIEPQRPDRLYPILLIAATRFQETKYRSACAKLFNQSMQEKRSYLLLPAGKWEQ